jgi:hypothetical protein
VLIRRTLVAVLVTFLVGLPAPSPAEPRNSGFSCDADTRTPVNTLVALRMANQTTLPAATIDDIAAVAGAVWARYGIRFEPARPQAAAVGVIVVPTRAPQPPHVDATALAATLFDNGQAAPTMYVWVGSAETLITSTSNNPVFTLLPKKGQDALISQMLGVALAHEFGHYLLNTVRHSATGLLRANIPTAEFLEPNLRSLGLNVDQQATLCHGLERLQRSTTAAVGPAPEKRSTR